MRKLSTKLITKVVADEQEANRVAISREYSDSKLKLRLIFQKMFTREESWAFEYDPKTKRNPNASQTKEGKSQQVKTMLVVFLAAKSVVQKD